MKRTVALLLVLAMAFGLFACDGGTLDLIDTEETTTTKGSERAMTTEETTMETTGEAAPYTGTLSSADPVALTALKGNLKICGKAVFDKEALHVDWPCAGFELTVDAAGGDLVIGYRLSTPAVVAVLVDGAEAARVRLTGSGSQAVAAIPAGTHVVTVMRDVESRPGAESVFTTVGFDGKVLDRPADKALYLEFIGDSIVSGNGVFTEGKGMWGHMDHSATHAFGYLTAAALNADVIISGKGSIGLVKTVEDSRGLALAMPSLYPFATGLSHSPRIKFDFASARVPDLVVLELSTNDKSSVTDEAFTKAATGFIQQIRDSYGKDIPIVWVYNLMVPDCHEEALHAVVTTLGGEENGLYTLEMVQGQNGGKGTTDGNNHPSYGDHQINADRLVSFLREKGLVG